MRSAWFLAVTLIGSSGCYRYVASEPGALKAGTAVAIDLTSSGTANVRPAIGDFVTSVEGSVTESNGSGVTLALMAVRRRGDVSPSTWTGESLHLASADIEGVKTRQFARGRTTVAAVALGAAAVGLVIAIARATGLLEVSGGGGKTVPPP